MFVHKLSSFSKTGLGDTTSIECLLAFDVITGPGGAVDALLIQAHANQTRVLLRHPAQHVL